LIALKIKLPEVMTLPLAETKTGDLSLDSYKKIKDFMDSCGVLAIGLVIMGVLLGQKPGKDDELASQLDQSRQTITELQTQLTASEQNVNGLTDQLTQAQQTIEALQTEIRKLKSPPLTPSEPFVYTGGIYRDSQLSFPIDLRQFENVQGEVTGGYPGLEVYIKDSGGSIVKDFGRTFT
jgi:uncharacterized coiled-coil protein SlyX